MEIINLPKLKRKLLLYNGFIFVILFIFLNRLENIQKYILIVIFIIVVLFFINKNISNLKNVELNNENIDKKIPKYNSKKLKKKYIKSIDNNVLKNFLLNINYLKKYNKYTINKIHINIYKFSNIEKKQDSYKLKYNIEKLKSLKNIIINDINSLFYTIPSIEGISDDYIYLEPLNDKLTYCLNIFNNYSDEIINNKIKINNKNFLKNISNNKEFIEELNLPQPSNSE